MLVILFLAGIFIAPATGDMNALISEAADYTVHTKGKHIEGAMFSCSSLGIKIGSGLGTAVIGLLLDASHYVANSAHQSTSTVAALNFMYLWIPMLCFALSTVIMYFLKVEKANEKFKIAGNNGK